MPAGKGAGTSPSTPQPLVNPIANNTADSKTITATSNQPSIGQPNTNSNTGMDVAPAGKGSGSLANAAIPSSPYAQPQDMSTFRNVDASGNPVNAMKVPNQYANTIGAPQQMVTNTQMPNGVSGKGGAAGGSQGKAGGGSTLEQMPNVNMSHVVDPRMVKNTGPQGPGAYF